LQLIPQKTMEATYANITIANPLEGVGLVDTQSARGDAITPPEAGAQVLVRSSKGASDVSFSTRSRHENWLDLLRALFAPASLPAQGVLVCVDARGTTTMNDAVIVQAETTFQGHLCSTSYSFTGGRISPPA